MHGLLASGRLEQMPSSHGSHQSHPPAFRLQFWGPPRPLLGGGALAPRRERAPSTRQRLPQVRAGRACGGDEVGGGPGTRLRTPGGASVPRAPRVGVGRLGVGMGWGWGGTPKLLIHNPPEILVRYEAQEPAL